MDSSSFVRPTTSTLSGMDLRSQGLRRPSIHPGSTKDNERQRASTRHDSCDLPVPPNPCSDACQLARVFTVGSFRNFLPRWRIKCEQSTPKTSSQPAFRSQRRGRAVGCCCCCSVLTDCFGQHSASVRYNPMSEVSPPPPPRCHNLHQSLANEFQDSSIECLHFFVWEANKDEKRSLPPAEEEML